MRALLLLLSCTLTLAQDSAPASHISRQSHEAALREQIAEGVVDQPIEAREVLGGRASVAMLHRTKPEPNGLSHDRVTETYYILAGAGTLVTGGTLRDAKPTDLSRVNAGMSRTGERQGGDSRRVKPGDIILIPAGTPHGFSELDGPISYLVYRFEPK